jgi:hypothetical protein
MECYGGDWGPGDDMERLTPWKEDLYLYFFFFFCREEGAPCHTGHTWGMPVLVRRWQGKAGGTRPKPLLIGFPQKGKTGRVAILGLATLNDSGGL